MADLAQLEAALIKADAAGDVDGARMLAGEVRKMRAAKPPPWVDTATRLARGMAFGGPMGLVAAGVGEGLHGLEKAGELVGDTTVDALAGHVPPEVAAGIGTVAKIAPSLAVGGTSGAKAGAPALESGAKWMMQSALKPGSKSIANGDAAKAIDTMLQEGISATAGGAAKLRIMISNLKAEVGKLISQSPAEVNRGYAYKELANTLDEVTKKGAGYNADRAAVLKAWDEFKNHPLLDKFAETSDMIPIQAADVVKRASQKAAESAYGSLTPPTAADKAQMAIASGLRQGMEDVSPGVASGNAKLAEYINALTLIEPRAGMAANRDVGGLIPLAHSPEAAMLMLADRNPWMKSYIARVLHEGQASIPGAAGAGAAVVGGQISGKNRP